MLLCATVTVVAVLLQPELLLLVAAMAALVLGAVGWGDARPVPGLEQPLELPQRLGAASMACSMLVHWSGSAGRVARIAVACAIIVLGHATFRARSLSSRWHRFFDVATKVD